MKCVVFTEESLFKLSGFSVSPEWFDNFDLPSSAPQLKRVKVGDVIYILEADLESDDVPLIVLSLAADASLFKDADCRVSTMDRVISVARSVYTNTVSIPTGWRQHKEGHVLSIQAPSRGKNWRARLHFDLLPQGNRDIFVFLRTEDIVNFSGLDPDMSVYDSARHGLVEAILAPQVKSAEDTMAGIVLSHRIPQGFVQGASLEQWYSSKLTAEQRSFVEKPYNGPVRLRGAAGTGKTLSLVIKFLRDGVLAEREGRPLKLGFLTHSSASVDLVSAIGESLDTLGLLQRQGKNCELEIRTLYDLAYEHLHFDLDNLSPLSLDGREGRRLQCELIEMVLKEMWDSKILRLQYESLSPALASGWQRSAESESLKLVAEIMNEFASVLDAEGVRVGEEKGERYAKGSAGRSSWLMNLAGEMDRRFILEAHRRYRKLLGDMNTLSVDQMVGDFNSFLDSNRWDRVRGRQGYDALFVDELHLFTSIERQTLHKLVRSNADEDGRPSRPVIFMAYDMKQSPSDTFLQYLGSDQNLFSASTGLQNSDLVKLEKVFRYTPQIAEFLSDLDATFPAMDVPGEWDAYAGEAQLEDGNLPELVVYKDDLSLFKSVFKAAERKARRATGGGRRVAVLCVSSSQFDKYVAAARGQFSGRHIAITSRDSGSELRHAGKRFILSMPEYVAGLQFESVFLIHVDVEEAPVDAGDGTRRRFISNVYLGSSRAENDLQICSSLTRGGESDILKFALERHSLRRVAPAP